MAHNSFIRTNFSPLGAQGRAQVAPQVFSYWTLDDLFGSAVKAPDYFPIDSRDPTRDNMLGVFKSNDWIMAIGGVPGDELFAILFIDNDGRDGNVITSHAVDIRAT